MESFLSFFSKELAKKTQFNPTFKNRFILKKNFSAAQKIACKGRSITAIAPLFMNCGL
jgi:hypothetical protein